MFIFYMRYR